MDSLNYIVTAKHYGESVMDYIKKQQFDILRSKNIKIFINYDAQPSRDKVKARIWQGQWIADCECGGASFVDPEEPVFFCFGCVNRRHDGVLRLVEFPENYKDIEEALLARPVSDWMGKDDRERAGMAQPILYVEGLGGLSRNWNPNETLEDLLTQNSKAILIPKDK